MIRQAIIFLRFAITIALAVGMILSSNAQTKSHNLLKIVEIMAQHQAEIKDHGHAHDDIVDFVHAFQSHGHEMADHDHNTAFLPPREAISTALPTSTRLTMADYAMPGRRDHGLDRPPRV
jgi:hypothetical protein